MKNLTYFFVLLIAKFSFGSEIKPLNNFIKLSEEDGLTTKTIYNIIQDRDGFLWLSSDAGVYRYDGMRFEHFTVNDGITDNEVLKVYQDKKDRIWFLTLNGYLSFWQNGKIHNPQNTSFLKDAYAGGSILSCFEDSQDRIWFGALKAGNIVIDENDSLTVHLWPADIRTYVHYYFYEDLNKNIWYFSRNKIINYKTGDSFMIPMAESPYFGCHTNKRAEFYYSSPSGIFRFDNLSHIRIIDSISAPFCRNIINMIYTDEGLFACTMGQGCFLIRDNKVLTHFFPGKSVTSVLQDREGNMWFSTMGEGVYVKYYSKTEIKNYNNNCGLSGNKIISLNKKKDELWLGYNNGCIDKLTGSNLESFKTLPDDQSFNRITSIISQGDTIWCGTDIGVYYIKNRKVNRIEHSVDIELKTPEYAIKQIVKDNSNNIYGVFSLNFLKLVKKNGLMRATPSIDSTFRIFSALANEDGSFLLAGMQGIYRYKEKAFLEPYKTDIDLSRERILQMAIDNDSMLICATNSNGIMIFYKNKLVEHFNKENGLPDDACRKIGLYNDLLYVCTKNGIGILQKKNGKWNIIKNISKKIGLISNSVNDIIADEGHLYLATDNGLSIIDINASEIPTYNGKVILTEIITNKSFPATSTNMQFYSNVQRLLIKFSYPVFNPMNKFPLKYRLLENKKMNQDWVETNNNEVEFSSLMPGNYVFQVSPVQNNGTGPITEFAFEIQPLWWQNSLAKIIYLLLLSGLIVFLVRRRTRRQFELRLAELRQKNLLEQERNRIASDMHDDIGGDLTQISIWSNILHSNIQDESGIVKKVVGLSNEILQKMDQIIWALNSINNHTTNLISYLHSYSSEFLESANLGLRFEILNEIPDFVIGAYYRRNIFLVVKELLNNTVKHSGADAVHIRIRHENSYMIIQYSDNGIGLQQENLNGDGFGMNTIVNRLKEINSKLEYPKTEKGFAVKLIINLSKLSDIQ